MLTNKLNISLIENNSMPVTESGCWLWLRPLMSNGYGQIRIDYFMWKAHRLSYFLYKGIIKQSLNVCHTCDNKSCVNPDHLYLGNSKQNALDAVNRGQVLRGERHPSSVLSDKKAIVIKQSYEQGQSIAQIARDYKVSEYCIHCVVHAKTWRHV